MSRPLQLLSTIPAPPTPWSCSLRLNPLLNLTWRLLHFATFFPESKSVWINSPESNTDYDVQVLNSYIDITLPRRQRGRELKETYFFDCKCVACVSPDVDSRQSFVCRRCSSLTSFKGVSQAYHSTCEVIHTLGIDSIVLDDADTATNQQIHQPVSCIQCNEGLVPSEGEFRDAINIARESLTKAFGLQNAG